MGNERGMRTSPAGSRASGNPGVRKPSSRSVLSRYGGLQRKTNDAEEERHTRRWMCSPRLPKLGRGNRQEAEVVMGGDQQCGPCGGLLYQLQHAEQRNVVAAKFLAAGRCIFVRVVTGGGCRRVSGSGRRVRNGCNTVPTACVRDTDEKRESPQPQDDGGKGSAIAAQ